MYINDRKGERIVEIKDLLPIGSVVMLKNGKKKVMIYGIKQTEQSTGKEYDYISVLYPEGNLGEGTQFLFNHSDIDQIYFRGWENAERDDFLDRLDKFYQAQ